MGMQKVQKQGRDENSTDQFLLVINFKRNFNL